MTLSNLRVTITYVNARRKGGDTMFDKAKFKYFLDMNSLTMKELAERININQTTLYRKVGNNGNFSREEIGRIKKELNLSDEEAMEIFFG